MVQAKSVVTLSDSLTSGGYLKLLIDGKWVQSASESSLSVMNPGDGREICRVPFAVKEEVDQSVISAGNAFGEWKDTPLTERVQYLFKIKNLLEAHFEELARINTQNHGKTIKESRGDIRRTIENVEAGIAASYTLLKGEQLDQIAQGIDEGTVKEPLGVFAILCPFNFPIMVPFWFLPFAIVAGCTVVVKPSEITPVPMTRVVELIQNEVRLPPGVLNLVHGSRETVESLIKHPLLKGVTFVGSTAVGRNVYRLAGEHGKRAIVQAGAKNSIVVMPDADMSSTVEHCISSLFGNAGQRCLAGANILTTSKANESLVDKLATRARELRVGYGLDEQTDMGPMVSKRAKEKVLLYVDKGAEEGASLVLDGRGALVKGYENGFYLGPTIFDDVRPDMTIAREEIFGPLGTIVETSDLDEAIEFINRSTNYGNAASIFTQNGTFAREFRRRVQAGNIGINIGVAAPVGFFPFGGMRDSFFGVLHGQMDSVDFFTDRKVVISRWS
jgi:malonate-semialdehyde dehydrogenase (acetylating)/methylmalonate-semialdehyde dehydrogenase